MDQFAVTSDYLETIVGDGPVLVVGPGMRQEGINEHQFFPMDAGLLWFLQKGVQIDIVDLPQGVATGGHHDIELVSSYLRALKKHFPLSDFRTHIGDIAHVKLPSHRYNVIWDHMTLRWSSIDPKIEPGVSIERSGYRRKKILANYQRMLKPEGKMVLAGVESEKQVEVNRDAYRVDRNVWDGFVFPPYLVENDLFLPRYSRTTLVEHTKESRILK